MQKTFFDKYLLIVLLIKLNFFSFLLDMTRCYFTVFGIKSQPRELTAVWEFERKLLIEKKEAASESYSWK